MLWSSKSLSPSFYLFLLTLTHCVCPEPQTQKAVYEKINQSRSSNEWSNEWSGQDQGKYNDYNDYKYNNKDVHESHEGFFLGVF